MRLAPETPGDHTNVYHTLKALSIPHTVTHRRPHVRHYAKGSVKPSSTSSSNYASWAEANIRRPNKAGGEEREEAR